MDTRTALPTVVGLVVFRMHDQSENMESVHTVSSDVCSTKQDLGIKLDDCTTHCRNDVA